MYSNSTAQRLRERPFDRRSATAKTLDYRLFAQDVFMGWTRQMTDAARSNGNAEQLITVGQDEAGLGDSPNIQFFAREINFTLHTGGPTTISFGTVCWRRRRRRRA